MTVTIKALSSLALSFLLVAVLALSHPVSASSAEGAAAKPAPAEALTPDQAKAALTVLQDDGRRKEVIDVLRAIASGQAASASPPTTQSDATLNADSLGAQLLLTVSNGLTEFMEDVGSAASSLARAPALWHWLRARSNDPATYSLLFDIAWKLAVVLGGALAVEVFAVWLLKRPLAALEAQVPFRARVPATIIENAEPPSTTAEIKDAPDFHRRHLNLTRIWQSLLRLPFVIGRFVLDILPVVAFAGTASLLVGRNIDHADVTKLAILNVVNGYVVVRSSVCIVRALFGPVSLFNVRGEVAAYIEIWTRRILVVAMTGIILAHIARLMGLYHPAYLAVIRLAMLVVHLLLVVVILQCRQPVADALRAPANATGVFPTFRNWLAGMWYIPAIGLALGAWAVWALDVDNGFSVLMHYVAGTLVVAGVTQLVSVVALGLIDRGFRIRPEVLSRFPGLEARANHYLPLFRRLVSAIIAMIGLIAVLEVWGVNAIVWFYGGQIGGRVVSAAVTIAIAAIVAAAVWEGSNALMDRKLDQLVREGAYGRAARLRTFQPMVRTTLLGVVLAVVILTALNQIGVNVVPLLAGAGILGVAIGFGSQKLVQDVITGLFMLIENNVQVGDTVTLSGLSGVVENVSIRTIRLRAGDGSVHILPFSAVTTITNSSRGAGNVPVSVAVAFKEDTDRVSEIIKDVVTRMREDDRFASMILGELELWGVDKVDGAMAVIVGQIRCSEQGRWPVQREFNRQLKMRFQEEGIAFAPPKESVSIFLPPLEKSQVEIEAFPQYALSGGRR
jgi:moderate conductance mechanosensitive channel